MLLMALGCVAAFAGSYRYGVPARLLTRAKERLGG